MGHMYVIKDIIVAFAKGAAIFYDQYLSQIEIKKNPKRKRI